MVTESCMNELQKSSCIPSRSWPSTFVIQHFRLQDRLGAIEEHSELGQGFHVAEKDMGIRGFGSLFGDQQSGDVANVGIDLFFDMLFDSLSKVS